MEHRAAKDCFHRSLMLDPRRAATWSNAARNAIDAGEFEEIAQFLGLLTFFNHALREHSLNAGMDFLDMFAMTDSGNGISNGQWHIDAYHLRPDAIVAAFEKHYLRA